MKGTTKEKRIYRYEKVIITLTFRARISLVFQKIPMKNTRKVLDYRIIKSKKNINFKIACKSLFVKK
jgi:hypothetical protein